MNVMITVILLIRASLLELESSTDGIHSYLQDSMTIKKQLSEKLKNLACKICVPGISIQGQHMGYIYLFSGNLYVM